MSLMLPSTYTDEYMKTQILSSYVLHTIRDAFDSAFADVHRQTKLQGQYDALIASIHEECKRYSDMSPDTRYVFVPDENNKPESNMLCGKILGYSKITTIDIYIEPRKSKEENAHEC